MLTILIVDDRRDVELVLGTQLKSQGFSVQCINDSTKLEEVVASGGIDVILLDLNMPELDGCEATQLLKASPVTRLIPVIMCTAHPLPGDRERALASGCDEFMEKPIRTEQLVELLQRLLKSPLRQLDESDDAAEGKLAIP
jgi:CheY-like chemotaxis protein